MNEVYVHDCGLCVVSVKKETLANVNVFRMCREDIYSCRKVFLIISVYIDNYRKSIVNSHLNVVNNRMSIVNYRVYIFNNHIISLIVN